MFPISDLGVVICRHMHIQYTYAESWLLINLTSELLCSSSVPVVDSHVATESLVTCEMSLLLVEMTPRKHSASETRNESRYM